MKKKYWKMSHNADTNETGLPMNRTYIKTVWQGFPAQQYAEMLILEDFCFERFGKKTAYVQGVAPCENWKIWESNKADFDAAQPILWGGSPTKTMRIDLGIGDRGKINILYEQET